MKKLPQIFQKNSNMTQIAKLFENKRIMFASSVYSQNQKFKVILKKSGKPIFDMDRPVYSMLRGISKTLITSAHNLTGEKDTFKVHYARGDKDIQNMYDALRDKQKQNVFVMTSHMKKEDIQSYINTDLYNLLGNETLKKREGNNITLNEVLGDLCDSKLTPILVECGPTIMNDYWKKCEKKKDAYHIEMMYFACFEGKMKQECIGEDLTFDESCYKKVWESDKMDVKDDMDNQGKLYMRVYEYNRD